jgi:hypothetical protein
MAPPLLCIFQTEIAEIESYLEVKTCEVVR